MKFVKNTVLLEINTRKFTILVHQDVTVDAKYSFHLMVYSVLVVVLNYEKVHETNTMLEMMAIINSDIRQFHDLLICFLQTQMQLRKLAILKFQYQLN